MQTVRRKLFIECRAYGKRRNSFYRQKNVALGISQNNSVSFDFKSIIKKVTWLDDGSSAVFEQQDEKVSVKTEAFEYGKSYTLRICKLEV